jgi:hypothetical protein
VSIFFRAMPMADPRYGAAPSPSDASLPAAATVVASLSRPTQAVDAMIAQELQQEELAEETLRAQKLGYDMDFPPSIPPKVDATWDSLMSRTYTTLSSIGDFLFGNGEPATPEGVSADRKRLLERLRFYGLKEKVVEGDGNCQFRALADQLWRNEKTHREVRRLVVARLTHHRDQYAPFALCDDYDAYLDRMAKDGEWGDHLTLQAAADVFDAEIVLVTSFPDDRSIIAIRPQHWGTETGGPKGARQTLYLSFFAEIHYNSLDVRLG